MQYHVMGLPEEMGATVRAAMRSPQYGHPAMRETARGTGPCRICLRRFEIGAEDRILFTYQPPVDASTVGAPGPVFIHAEACVRYRAEAFPDDLRPLPVILEGRAGEGRVLQSVRIAGTEADRALRDMFAREDVEYAFIRHGEAGCHIARADRGPLPNVSGTIRP